MFRNKEQTPQATELVYILDRSGSMAGLESDTIGGFNSMLAKQQKLPGDCRVTTVLFDHQLQLLHDRIDLEAVRPLTSADYYVGGMTALLDAIGTTIAKIDNAQAFVAKGKQRPKVLVVIITDGYENSSKGFSAPLIKSMVESKKELGWEFVFLGANIDSVETAGAFGIDSDFAVDYVADKQGTALNFDVLDEVQTAMRCDGAVPREAFDRIRSDAQSRG